VINSDEIVRLFDGDDGLLLRQELTDEQSGSGAV
jgi:hypothetical protein